MPEYRAHDPGSGAHAYGYSARCPHFHAFIHDPALVDAILDRLIYSSHKLELKGESMRKRKIRTA
ncbi:MAG TPA: ATP-binding protein [Pseudomonas sp.]|nr:ATP-binding protein [Pseudomonas sp.]